jgi:hypothetical protein
LAIFVIGGCATSDETTTTDAVTTTATPTTAGNQTGTSDNSGTQDEDVRACRAFRNNFVESDWGVLAVDEVAAMAVGSTEAAAVVSASSEASSAIRTAGELFSATSPSAMENAINSMLIACASVAT